MNQAESTAWIRLSRTCQNACVFCSDADVLDGTVVPMEEVTAALQAARDGGATHVVLSGGEPTLSKHLLGAIKAAKALGLHVTLTTNGRIVQSDKIASMLEAAGLDEIRVSVHSGRRTTHDALVGKKGGWIDSLAGLRFMGKTGVRVVMTTVLTQQNRDDLGHLMHMGTMAGVKHMELRDVANEGAAARPGVLEQLRVPTKHALTTLSTLWFEAKEEVLLFTAVGFDHSQDAGIDPHGEVRQADPAALRLLRQRVGLAQAGLGTTMLDGDGLAKDFVALCEGCGGLAAAGVELNARFATLVDAPWCVGGHPTVAPDHHAPRHEPEACGDCALADRCPRLPKKLAKLDVGQLGPLLHWGPTVHGSVAVTGGDDDLLRTATLPALAEALTALGLDARYVADPSDAQGADSVVCGDVASARGLTAARMVVLDTRAGLGFDALERTPDLVESFSPSAVSTLLAGGVSPRGLRWRLYPVPPEVGQAPPAGNGPVVALGELGDARLLDAALVASTGKLPPVEILGAMARVPGMRGTLLPDADDAATLAAILRSRMVVLVSRRVTTPEEAALHARDLRWLAVAQAAGRPVVAVRAPGVEDQVRHDVTGWLCVPGAHSDLSEALRRVSGEAVRFTRYAAAARAFGATALPEAWAHDLAHGLLPDARPRLSTPTRPWPAW